MDSHAQFEIRIMAHALALLIIPHVPVGWEAFEDYRLNACAFSAQEMDILRSLLTNVETYDILEEAENLGRRETDELLAKLGRTR